MFAIVLDAGDPKQILIQRLSRDCAMLGLSLYML